MIYSAPRERVVALLNGADADRVGTLTLQLEKSDGSTIQYASTEDIIEVEPGNYVANRTAPDEAGTYVFVWKDGAVSGSEELIVTYTLPGPSEPPTGGIYPSVDEVAALIRTRTKSVVGNEVGTFDDDTRPTQGQVESIIAQASNHVSSRLGGELCQNAVDQGLETRVRNSAALYAAMLIELSYFPEQVNNNVSPYAQYKDLFDSDMKELSEEVSEACGGQGSGDNGKGSMPAFNFDSNEQPIGKDGPSW